MCLLSNNVYDYVFVSQGKITIAGVDDGEECTLTDVSYRLKIESIRQSIVECPYQNPLIFWNHWNYFCDYKFCTLIDVIRTDG